MTTPLPATFPVDITDPLQWTAYLTQQHMDAGEVLAYISKLYQREMSLGTRFHQTLVALVQLQPEYTPPTPDAALAHLVSCVECNQSVVVDATENGHFLACGHIMHSFCMATFCANNDVAPGCPKCGVRFYPPALSTVAQLHYTELFAAIRILQAADVPALVAKMRHDYVDSGITTSSLELERLILAGQSMDNITTTAQAVIARERLRLKQTAQTLVAALVPSLQQPFPFPPVPDPKKSVPGATAAEPTPKRLQPPMPPTLEPDVLPPDNADSFGTGPDKVVRTRYNNTFVMFTKFAGQCKGCRRAQTANRSIIASAPNNGGFLCTMCVFSKTSAQVFNEIVGIDVADMF